MMSSESKRHDSFEQTHTTDIEQLSPIQLEAFYSHLVQHYAHGYGGHDSNYAREFCAVIRANREAEYVMTFHQKYKLMKNEAFIATLQHIYPSATEEEMDQLATIEGVSFDVFSPSLFDTADPQHSIDNKLSAKYLHGTDEGFCPYPQPRPLTPETTDGTVRQRITDGMPRELQLLASARIIAYLPYTHQQRYENIPASISESLQLSEGELLFTSRVAQLIRSTAPIAEYFLVDEQLSRIFHDAEGDADIEKLGGYEVVARALQHSFKEVVINRNQEHWEKMVAAIGGSVVDELLPYLERRELIYESFSDNPRRPEGLQKRYITETDVGTIIHTNITEYLEEELPAHGNGIARYRYTHAHAAAEFGLNDRPFRLLELKERHSKPFEKMSDMAPDESQLLADLESWELEIAHIDPILVNLLKDYVHTKRNTDLDPMPTDGWSGYPGEDEVAESLANSRAAAHREMQTARLSVEEYIQQNPAYDAVAKNE